VVDANVVNLFGSSNIILHFVLGYLLFLHMRTGYDCQYHHDDD
jgi:hypothetical protein